jgi:carboxynorspermidine decarboxylase
MASAPALPGRRVWGERSSAERCTAFHLDSATPMSLNCWSARTTWYSTPLTRWSGSGRSGKNMLGVFPSACASIPSIQKDIPRSTTPALQFEGRSLDGVEGLHFHTLCEQLFEPLERTAAVFEERFGEFLPRMKWLNLGGGHHITRPGYDIDGLVGLIRHFREKYNLMVYLEPGEAIALNTGILTAEVLDIVRNEMEIAILDVSVACHMPDVLEMPYRPGIHGAFDPGEKAHDYRLGGPSCLAGDIIGDWSFERRLRIGDRLAFLDMAHYTMVKNTTFNGIRLPSICTWEPETEALKVVRSFRYEDFKSRLS